MSLLTELRRRNVIRMAGLYLVGAWLIVQVAGTVLPMYEAPAWLARAIVTLLAIGFIPTMIFSWVFELTPEGLKREKHVEPHESIMPETGRMLDRVIMIVLALALGYFAFDKFVLAPRRDAAVLLKNSEEVAEARKQGGAEALVQAYGDKSIAVLPFTNMSTDKDQEFFADGISEELLNLLAKIPQLRVIARTSSFSFKGKDVDVATIAKALSVAHVLEGSIRKSGNKLRITAQLVRAADSSHLWSETYDRDMADIFAVQDEISAAVVAQLKLKLLGGAPTAKAVNPQAYELFLRARQLVRQRTAAGYTQAMVLLQQALEIDPAYAAAWTQLGVVYLQQAGVGERSIAEGNRLAREAANKALALDPDFAPAYANLGWISMHYDRDLAAAAQQFTRAFALAPDDNDVLRTAAVLAQSLGRIDTAIAMAEAAVARDPASAVGHVNLGYLYLYAARPDDAIASCRTALRLSPGAIVAHYISGKALLAKGQPQAALAEMKLEPAEAGWDQIGLPVVWHALGRKTESDAALAKLIQEHEKDSAYNIAYVYAERGEADRAFEWLAKAVAYQDGGLAQIVVQPEFAKLHDDPRWLPFLRKLGKSPEQLAAIKFDVKLPGAGAAANSNTPAGMNP
jgi:TolB-like protein/Flp pilus assembly protein TadD